MAMVSPKLRKDMARRTRAAHARIPSTLTSGNPRYLPRSSSLPAAARPRMHNLDVISATGTDDDDLRSRSATSLADLITPTRYARMAGSVPPPTNSVRFHLDGNEPPRFGASATSPPRRDAQQVGASGEEEENLRPSLKAVDAMPEPTAAQQTASRGAVDAEPSDQEGTEFSGDSLSGTTGGGGGGGGVEEAQAHSSGSSRTGTSVEEENVEFSHERSAEHSLDLGMPGKLMELMEDRDKAVHLCLQYRCKLKTTESSLRTEERRASGLKRRLREATAAGESTKKLFDQIMEKSRAEESERLRRAAKIAPEEQSAKTLVEEARKVRLQLARAQKDLRGLWLERDELDAMAKRAAEGEQAGRRRVKQLEQVNARLRQKADAVAMSGKKAAEEMAHAEARAVAAEVAERDLRTAVEAIKRDFEVLVCDLHLREKRIERLEEENAALAAAAGVVARPTTFAKPPPFPRRGHPRSLQNATEEGRTAMDDEPAADFPTASIQIGNTCRSDGTREGGGYVSQERRLPNTRTSDGGREGGYVFGGGEYTSSPEQKGTAEAVVSTASVTLRGCEFEGQIYEGGGERGNDVCVAEVSRGTKNTMSTVVAAAGAAPNAATIVRPTRRQLNPQFAVIPGRVTAISYPRCGSRVTIERPAEKKPLSEDRGNEPGGGMEAVDRRAAGDTKKAHDDDAEQVETPDVIEKAYNDAGKLEAPDASEQESDNAGKLEALGVTEKPCDDDADKLKPPDFSEKEYDNAGILEAQGRGGGQAAPCPEPPTPRRLSDERVVGLTPAPPFPSRPSHLPAECAFSKTAPLLSDGSVCTAICTPDAKLRFGDKVINSLDDKLRWGDVEPASAAEETRLGGNGGGSGSAEGRGRTNGGVAVESASTPRLGINDRRNGDEERHEAQPSARVGEDKGEAHSFEAGLPTQSRKNEDPLSDMFASRLVDGVPVLKYGGKGKPKPKVLWVTPDLSELFYTRVGRTKNSKRTSHMPLAGLHAARGRNACPEIVGARHDRCFALLRDGSSANSPHGGQGQNSTQTSEVPAGSSENQRGSTAPGRLRWGVGGTRSPGFARGRSSRGGSGSRSMGQVGLDETGSTTPRPGARERMGLETASVEECDALVAEINHLVRRAGSKEDVVSSRGHEIFHAWCRSAVEDGAADPPVAAAVPLRGTGGEARTSLVCGRADT